jgi:hypothetical protein
VPVTTVTDYSLPLVELEGQVLRTDKCEATGDDIGLGIFERYELQQGQDLLDTVEAQGGTVVAIDDPALAGAVGWANGVMIESDGVWWYATAITPETLGQLDSPAAYDVSAQLLAAWLGIG